MQAKGLLELGKSVICKFSLTYTIRQTEILEFQNSWFTNTPFVKILYPHKKRFFLYFRKLHDVFKCCAVKNLSIFYVSCKTVYLWVKTNCCFVSKMRNNILGKKITNFSNAASLVHKRTRRRLTIQI